MTTRQPGPTPVPPDEQRMEHTHRAVIERVLAINGVVIEREMRVVAAGPAHYCWRMLHDLTNRYALKENETALILAVISHG